MRLQIKHEIQKSDWNLQFIENLMQMTFVFCHPEIIEAEPLVKDALQKWAALVIKSQVKHTLNFFWSSLLRFSISPFCTN